MKKVLLTTSALVAFAGFAAAEVTFGGEATVGYNDVEEGGIYTDGSLDITGSAEFDGGVSLSVTYGLDLYSGDFDAFPTITVTTQWATLTVGDVEYAAVDMFADVDGMDGVSGFREINDEVVARVDLTLGGFALGVATDANEDYNNADQLSIGLSGELGAFSMTAGYDMVNEVMGVSLGGAFGGFDVDVAYMTDYSGEDSIGLGLGATMGGVGLTGYYAINSNAADAYGVGASFTSGPMMIGAYWDGDDTNASNFGVDVEYAVNDSVSAFAGWDEADGFYVYGTMAAGAATVGAGYAEYSDAGPEEIREGVSVWITMPF
jgi:outer membrane protein OmpU